MTIASAPARDRRQAAVSDAAKRLYDAEAALHLARQTGVGSWISAAYDRLHEAIAGHGAAVDALKGCDRAVPPACGGVSLGAWSRRGSPAQNDLRPVRRPVR